MRLDSGRSARPASIIGASLCAILAGACAPGEGVTPERERKAAPQAAFVNLSGEFWLFSSDMEEVTGSPFRIRVSETDCENGRTATLDLGPSRIRLFDDHPDPTVLDRMGHEKTTTRLGCDGVRSEFHEPFRDFDGIYVASPDSIWLDRHEFCGGGPVCLGTDGEVSSNLDRAVRTVEGFEETVMMEGREITLTYVRESALPVDPPR